MINEARIKLQNDNTLIRTEEGIYFLQVGEAPALLLDPHEAADALLKLVQSDLARIVARNLVAWDTSKDKREGLLPEVYLSNRVWYERLTGEEYYQHKAIKKFGIE
ncbi:hypothetical protein NDK47_17815 [Brevibacillus ruminantium]|uniref:Uncharacterized protein n=1 Tax=Brevibacillus ruminantium TaxID=2950604 RepID=A0ABY4WDJ3_9BACL|nr:hypothetical protein [Brevibacillus ruminantium]USG64007.1 hypothetical protein NDK47_17815 [Brevibacillus ruminantium]